jgi:hypothetical protein
VNWVINAKDWVRNTTSPILDGSNPTVLRTSAASVVAMSLGLTTAGRLGFFIDYSERTTVGTHTFYVARTHGSTNAVSVDYSTGGDGHTNVSGTLTWADGELDIKSFTVAVTSSELTNHQSTLGLGEHRIVARLSNPTGGSILHFGVEETKSYGVIDNSVLASDANAVFYDSSAAGVGTGTQADPYNNAVTAIQNIGSKRYLYGRGITVTDSTYTDTIAGSSPVECLPAPANRLNESERVFIRNWPGSTWGITGTGTSSAGFFAENGESFCTYKGLDFFDMDNTTAAAGFGVWYRNGNSASINIEGCTASNLNGQVGDNHGGYMIWGGDGGKIWRCTADNIQNGGDNQNPNTALFLTYNAVNISIQRCEVTNAACLVYHKRVLEALTVSTSVRFCVDQTPYGVNYGTNADNGPPHAHTIVQCNVFLPMGVSNTGIVHNPGSQGQNGSNNGGKHWFCNNVFYGRGSGEKAAIHGRQMYGAAIFNNIMLDCQKVWADFLDSSTLGPEIEFADFNCEFGTASTSQKYEWKGVNYANAALLNADNSAYAGNDINQDPLFVDAVNGDFTLQVGSPALNNGISNTQQGLYLSDFYTIGAN